MYHLPDFLQQIAGGTVRFADVYGHFVVFLGIIWMKYDDITQSARTNGALMRQLVS
jgi:hypothetical protein